MNQTLSSYPELHGAALLNLRAKFREMLAILHGRKMMWKAFGILLFVLGQLTFGASGAHALSVS
jgi:hypothetical protein